MKSQVKVFRFKPTKRNSNDGLQADRTNSQRADVGRFAVDSSLSVSGDPAQIDRDAITDLLADVAHFCDQQGENFDDCVASAKIHWQAER